MEKNKKENKVKRRGTTWCSAANCFSNKISDPNLSFFRFPINEDR